MMSLLEVKDSPNISISATACPAAGLRRQNAQSGGPDFLHRAGGQNFRSRGRERLRQIDHGAADYPAYRRHRRRSSTFDGKDILRLPNKEVRELRKQIQMIFQDPYASLNPRMRVVDIIGRPVTIFYGAKGRKKVDRVASCWN